MQKGSSTPKNRARQLRRAPAKSASEISRSPGGPAAAADAPTIQARRTGPACGRSAPAGQADPGTQEETPGPGPGEIGPGTTGPARSAAAQIRLDPQGPKTPNAGYRTPDAQQIRQEDAPTISSGTGAGISWTGASSARTPGRPEDERSPEAA